MLYGTSNPFWPVLVMWGMLRMCIFRFVTPVFTLYYSFSVIVKFSYNCRFSHQYLCTPPASTGWKSFLCPHKSAPGDCQMIWGRRQCLAYSWSACEVNRSSCLLVWVRIDSHSFVRRAEMRSALHVVSSIRRYHFSYLGSAFSPATFVLQLKSVGTRRRPCRLLWDLDYSVWAHY